MHKQTILLTGWEGPPSDPDFHNTSGIIVQNIHGLVIEGYTVEGALLSVDPRQNYQEWSSLLRTASHAACVSIGVMPTPCFRLETVGVNEVDTKLFATPVAGEPERVRLLKQGLNEYTNTTLCVERVAEDMKKDGFTTRVNDKPAGRAGCNGVVCCQGELAPRYPDILFLFGHIPYHPELAAHVEATQGGPMPSMDIHLIQGGVASMIAAVARQRRRD